jgi:hypothetical protein
MYEMAKKGRDAMKSKARMLAGEKDRKVDSSDWTPAEPLNADAKTGMRPVSRRAYKSGGKVSGEACDMRADRKPRKAGGKAEQPPVDRYINRDLKKANDYRDGKKHIGGMKKGGRTGKMNGGAETANKMTTPEYRKELEGRQTPKTSPHVAPATKGAMDKPMDMSTMTGDEAAAFMKSRKAGGRTKKMMGGAKEAYDKFKANVQAFRKPTLKNNNPEKRTPGDVPGGRTPGDVPVKGYIPGTNVEASDIMDANERARLERGRKAGGRTKKMDGGLAMLSPLAMGINALRGDKDEKKSGGRTKKMMGGPMMGGGMDPRMGMVKDKAMEFMGQGAMVPGLKKGGKAKKDGGRTAHASGGKVGKKGTNINIVIQAGQKPAPADAGMMPPPPMPGGIPMPAPGASAPPMGGMGAGLPPGLPPMPAPPMGGGMPMARKTGGRVAKSYKDMTAGAGSGEGRLEKTDIQRSKRVRGS